MLGLSLAHILGRERLRRHPVCEVVDYAKGRVRQSHLSGDYAFRGDGHAYDVGVLGDQGHLGRRLDPRPGNLPVNAPVLYLGCGAERIDDLPSPGLVEPGYLVRSNGVERRHRTDVQRDEIVGNNERAGPQVGPQAADRRDADDAVAPGIGKVLQVARVIDRMRKDIWIAMTIDCHDPVCGRDQPGSPAAEDDTERTHG